MAAGEESAKSPQQWAEETYPGCSTVLSSATRLSAMLAEVWETLADLSSVTDGKPRVLLFPDCPAVAEARGLQSIYEHLEVCQDVCDHFGSSVSVVPHPKGGPTNSPAPALVVQSVSGADGGDDFGYDADWDDDWDIDRSLLGDDDEGGVGAGEDVPGSRQEGEVDVEALGVVPGTDEEVTELTKSWVQAVITDMGVCPFSVDASRAGLPIGDVRYPVTRETTAEAIYREYWNEVDLLVSEKDERSLSTTLLITPEFALNNAEAFELMSQTLTQPLEALHFEDDIQLVFFHPQYAFRDGGNRLGSGGAANYARRSPFPMINILRTKQVRLAQRSIPTGLVYKQNEEVLQEIGARTLQSMLETRDWTALEGKKVDRRKAEYYEIARKLQGLDKKLSSAAGPVETSSESLATNEATEVDAVQESSSLAGTVELEGAGEASFRIPGTEEDAETGTPSVGSSSEVETPTTQSDAGRGVFPQRMAAMSHGQASANEAVAKETPAEGGSPSEASPASSSEGISEEDLRTVASAILARLGTGKPLKPEVFDGFSKAVDNMLRHTAATP